MAQFYNIFMISLLITSQLNEAKYLWKRIPSHFKPSEPSNAAQQYLRILWEIGVGLWERDLAKTFSLLLATSWPETLERHARNLRLSILRDTIRRLSTVHNQVSLAMLENAIGHSQQVLAAGKCFQVVLCQSLSYLCCVGHRNCFFRLANRLR